MSQSENTPAGDALGTVIDPASLPTHASDADARARFAEEQETTLLAKGEQLRQMRESRAAARLDEALADVERLSRLVEAMRGMLRHRREQRAEHARVLASQADLLLASAERIVELEGLLAEARRHPDGQVPS